MGKNVYYSSGSDDEKKFLKMMLGAEEHSAATRNGDHGRARPLHPQVEQIFAAKSVRVCRNRSSHRRRRFGVDIIKLFTSVIYECS